MKHTDHAWSCWSQMSEFNAWFTPFERRLAVLKSDPRARGTSYLLGSPVCLWCPIGETHVLNVNARSGSQFSESGSTTTHSRDIENLRRPSLAIAIEVECRVRGIAVARSLMMCSRTCLQNTCRIPTQFCAGLWFECLIVRVLRVVRTTLHQLPCRLAYFLQRPLAFHTMHSHVKVLIAVVFCMKLARHCAGWKEVFHAIFRNSACGAIVVRTIHDC